MSYLVIRLYDFVYFQEVLHVAQTDMQLAACSAFLQILQNDLVPITNYTQTFLQTILMSLDSRDPGMQGVYKDDQGI